MPGSYNNSYRISPRKRKGKAILCIIILLKSLKGCFLVEIGECHEPNIIKGIFHKEGYLSKVHFDYNGSPRILEVKYDN